MISCAVLNYNSKNFIKACLDSLAGMKYSDKELIFIDNASLDGSQEFVLKNYPFVRLVANKENLGYAGAANQAIKISSGEFVMILNPDIVFEPDYLDFLLKKLNKDKKIGAIIGKLKKYDFDLQKKTNLIDSAGLLMLKSRRCIDRGQGEEDKGQYDFAEEVFGVTGACPLYRKEALEDCKIGGEIFDNNFFMYKEDVDLSWRMRLLGWKCFYEPKALAYHGRGTGALPRSNVFEIASRRKSLSKFQRFYSYKNERLMRVKNEIFSVFARDFFRIFWKEFLMGFWMIFREPFLFKALFKFFTQAPKALLRRREIMRKKKISDSEMARWFV